MQQRCKRQVRIAAGLEYSLGALKVRGAFYTEPAPAPDQTLGPAIPDINRRNVGIFGLGYDLGFGVISAHFEHMFISDREVPTWSMGFDDEGSPTGYDNMAGTYSLNINTFMIGMDLYFNK